MSLFVISPIFSSIDNTDFFLVDNCFAPGGGDSPPPPPPDVAQNDLMMRLGLLLGDRMVPPQQGRQQGSGNHPGATPSHQGRTSHSIAAQNPAQGRSFMVHHGVGSNTPRSQNSHQGSGNHPGTAQNHQLAMNYLVHNVPQGNIQNVQNVHPGNLHGGGVPGNLPSNQGNLHHGNPPGAPPPPPPLNHHYQLHGMVHGNQGDYRYVNWLILCLSLSLCLSFSVFLSFSLSLCLCLSFSLCLSIIISYTVWCMATREIIGM